MTREEKAERVLQIAEKFIADQKIVCSEAVYQSDRVIENAYEFIEAICNVAGYFEYDED
jgi:glutaminase